MVVLSHGDELELCSEAVESFHPFYFNSIQNVKQPEISLAGKVLHRKCNSRSQ